MAEADVASPRSPTLEALQNRSRDVRRARPPDITILRNENRLPLRPERLAKRESRIGLRSIFGRSKPGKDDKAAEETPPSPGLPRSGGKRSSLADIGSWPQRLHSSRSELSLLRSPQSSAKPPRAETPALSSRSRQGNSNNDNKSKTRQPASPKARGPINAFDPPPLFKMYPQAVKHITLPTCATSIEALVRFSESKDSLAQSDFSRSDSTLDQRKASRLGRKSEGESKKKSKFAPEWTNKIYALVTSGYLLQYAAEGPFNRLPEKVLHLTRDSAAYASDLIPGRHWVVRVTSSTDADGKPSTDTKSLRTKLALRGIEKRQVSNMLLVFESPETMDTWLAILRREIESLGGKKKLSETGKPEEEDSATTLKAQASQRTLVVRDPARFSRIISQDFSWSQENALADPTEESEFREPPPERMSESTIDDGSSLVSSEGIRLENLRDSGSGSSGNRLSFVSSGQRTIVSSAESSPTSSPIRASFSSQEEYLFQKNQTPLPPTPEVRPRPNAAAIAIRRQSMQTRIPTIDPRLDVGGQPSPTLPTPQSSNDSKHQFVPNFSVPHTVGRRYSAMTLSVVTPRADQTQGLDRDGLIRPIPFRRGPPTTLPISRPLSIVLDQPSPISPYSPTTPNSHGLTIKVPDTPTMFRSLAGTISKPQSPKRLGSPKKSRLPKKITPEFQLSSSAKGAGRRSMDNLRTRSSPHTEVDKSPIDSPTRAQPVERIASPELIQRPASSFEMRRAPTAPEVPILLPYNRTNPSGPRRNRHSLSIPKQSPKRPARGATYTLTPPLACSPKRSVPSLKALQPESPSKQFLAVDTGSKALQTRRSMPHLSEGPPPAPPPTCALPPIPRKRSTNMPRSVKA